MYVGETERPIRETFQEHNRDAKTLAVRSPWGAHFRECHRAMPSDPHLRPFHRTRIITTSSSLQTRRMKEAVFYVSPQFTLPRLARASTNRTLSLFFTLNNKYTTSSFNSKTPKNTTKLQEPHAQRHQNNVQRYNRVLTRVHSKRITDRKTKKKKLQKQQLERNCKQKTVKNNPEL